jgi:hypothetical protein
MTSREYLLAKQYENDRLCQAAHEHLVDEALAAARHRPEKFCFLLACLGRLLVKWGTRLQQYQPVSTQTLSLKKTG